MGPLLSNISKDHRFHRPGTADLAQDVKVFVVDTPDALTDAQLLALTLNEICVLKGKGHFIWYPSHLHNVMTLFHDTQLWSEHRTD